MFYNMGLCGHAFICSMKKTNRYRKIKARETTGQTENGQTDNRTKSKRTDERPGRNTDRQTT
jgi:hypothetical protein